MIGLCQASPALAWTPDVEADLARVAEESDGELTVESLRAGLSLQRARLWLVSDGAGYCGCVVTEAAPGKMNLVVVRLRYHGHLGQVLKFFGGHAAESGLRLVAYSRRPGMARLLARHGWKPTPWQEYAAP